MLRTSYENILTLPSFISFFWMLTFLVRFANINYFSQGQWIYRKYNKYHVKILDIYINHLRLSIFSAPVYWSKVIVCSVWMHGIARGCLSFLHLIVLQCIAVESFNWCLIYQYWKNIYWDTSKNFQDYLTKKSLLCKVWQSCLEIVSHLWSDVSKMMMESLGCG